MRIVVSTKKTLRKTIVKKPWTIKDVDNYVDGKIQELRNKVRKV